MVKRNSDWVLCRFISARTADGRAYANEWRRLADLVPLASPAAKPDFSSTLSEGPLSSAAMPDVHVVPLTPPPPARSRRIPHSADLDGPAWQPPPPVDGDVRVTRQTASRRVVSALHTAYHDITGELVAPRRLALHAAPLMAPYPAFAYLACVAAAAVPHPSLNVAGVEIPKGYARAMRSEHAEYWRNAVDEEWQGILSNDTLDFVKRSDMPPGSNLMNSHYIFDCKPRIDGSVEKFKARLVADGNTQKMGIDVFSVFATVVKLPSLRIVLAIAAQRDLGLWQYDVKQAFLQSKLDEPLYMRMPPNVPDRDADNNLMVCLLKKTLYGLRQSARAWADTLARALQDFGFVQSAVDTCVYTWSPADVSGDDVRAVGDVTTAGMVLCVWVDDIILAYGRDVDRERFATHLKATLPVDDRGVLAWMLRMAITRDRAACTLTISQEQYTTRLLERYLPAAAGRRNYDTPLEDGVTLTLEQCPEEGSAAHLAMAARRADYMSIVGALLWLAAGTRPDITFATSLLARFCSNPAEEHYSALMRLLGYLRTTAGRVLRFCPDVSREIDVYSDASWATRHSVSGGIVLYMNCPITWWSRRQRSIAASTTEAEYFAAALASREGVYARDFVDSVGFPVTRPTPLFIDSKAALDLAADPVAFKKTKHILRHAYELRDRVLRRVFSPEYVDTTRQLADILTKGLRLEPHRTLLDRLLPVVDPVVAHDGAGAVGTA